MALVRCILSKFLGVACNSKVLQEIFRSGIKNINTQGWKREGNEESEKLR